MYLLIRLGKNFLQSLTIFSSFPYFLSFLFLGNIFSRQSSFYSAEKIFCIISENKVFVYFLLWALLVCFVKTRYLFTFNFDGYRITTYTNPNFCRVDFHHILGQQPQFSHNFLIFKQKSYRPTRKSRMQNIGTI